MSDDQYKLWKADLDARNGTVDSGLAVSSFTYKLAHEAATKDRQESSEPWVPTMFGGSVAAAQSGAGEGRHVATPYGVIVLPPKDNRTDFDAAMELLARLFRWAQALLLFIATGLVRLLAIVAQPPVLLKLARGAAVAIGYLIAGCVGLVLWIALVPYLPLLGSLALSRLEPWAYEAGRLLALLRGVPTTAEIHFCLLVGVVVAQCAAAWLVLWWRTGLLRKAGVTMLAFAATEVLIAWQSLVGGFAEACPGFTARFPDPCTLSVWEIGQSLAALAPPLQTLSPEAWQGTALVVAAGLLVGAITHAALLILVLIDDL